MKCAHGRLTALRCIACEYAKGRPAIDLLRRMVSYYNYQNETFNQGFTFDELHKIFLFSLSEQGGRVPELADTWPRYLLEAVLAAPLGACIDEMIVKRAGQE